NDPDEVRCFNSTMPHRARDAEAGILNRQPVMRNELDNDLVQALVTAAWIDLFEHEIHPSALDCKKGKSCRSSTNVSCENHSLFLPFSCAEHIASIKISWDYASRRRWKIDDLLRRSPLACYIFVNRRVLHWLLQAKIITLCLPWAVF